MEDTLNPPKNEMQSFSSRMNEVVRLMERPSDSLKVEGLHGASRALFLVHLWKDIKRPIVVFTPDQNTGETLLGDLKYFFHYFNIRQQPQFFPSWELLPYEHLSPLGEISGERLSVLNQLANGKCPFLVVPVEAALQNMMPKSALKKSIFPVKTGDHLEREFLETCLLDNGFTRVNLVEERGDFSVRGDIVDLFQPGAGNPVRIEFFGDDVESIRDFDPVSQVSIEHRQEINILPVREICLTSSMKDRGIQRILTRAREQGCDPSRLKELTEKIEHLGSFSGIEHLAPFFYEERENLFDYLADQTLIVLDEEEMVHEKCQAHHDLALNEFDNAVERGDVGPVPDDFYLDPDKFIACVKSKTNLSLNTLKLSDNGSEKVVHFEVKPIPAIQGQFDNFAEMGMQWIEDGSQVTVVAPTKGQVRRVHQLLDENGLPMDVDLGFISSGFQFPGIEKTFVAECEIFGRTHKHRYRRKPKSQSFQRGFKDLKPGDFLVHIDYGIGRYEGTRELQTGVGGGEFLEIQYAGNETLYIPMEGLGYTQKYLGSGDSPPPLSSLGGVSWKRQKKKIKESLQEMAEYLLKLYANREISPGFAFSSNPVIMQEFADSFEFEETEDQLKAIEEVIEDLEKDKCMDRLICGDVGYGKTEVAMRAAIKVVLDKKQVVVLVPTTILAQQHQNTFGERFRNYPINIESVSRFRSPKEQKQILGKLKKGEVDIIIGTHRLLSKDVEFADLGLIILDEEQRFGVKHKEKLKQFRAEVDILTLTATPIPRTLHFSLMGVRDMSVIETPPSDRLSVKTFVRKFDEKVIREAILRELDRKGQIFFVHNKVKSIHSMAGMVRRLVPQARLGIAHGQLPEKQLEKVMKNFIDHEIDILLCTSIVESGLDIPSANTIIINRADQFGLAQLYQLRGRVGRYKHQAYAYLLIPGALAITPVARKRISAIEEMSDLGSGFQLASRDMEIRGVGDMLGHKQSGHIATVGFDLYCKLIEDTVRELKGEKVETPIEPEIDFMIKGFIPKDYIPDLNQRLEIYRRLQQIHEMNDRVLMENELVDRYGPLPESVDKLMGLIDVKILCQKLHISKALAKRNEALLTLEPTTPIVTSKLTSMVDQKMRISSEYQISIQLARKGWKQDLETVINYLKKLSENGNEVPGR